MDDTNNSEKDKTENPIDTSELIEILITSLKSVKINEIVDSTNKVKIEKINAEKTYSDKNLSFWKWRFTKEVIVILLVLLTIALLSLSKVIEGSIVGTLLGSVIGYSIGNGFDKGQKT